MDKVYTPKHIEEKWYSEWLRRGLFHSVPDNRPPYSIVIPPPNVTGSLHMGHALNNTLQDIMIRYKKMQGFNTVWIPGTDHAGIATQNVVERQLAKEGLDRFKLGREKFIQRVWEWKKQSGDTIVNQLMKLGVACDWSRQRFTMDEGLSRAVKEVFVRLYNEGLIYRGEYIINWCPRCFTALSDLEIEHKDEAGKLYYIFYPFQEGNGGITVATTRPETMLGDTAVAINPEDARYKGLVGRLVVVPIVNRPVPVISDQLVHMDFGTGAVKITPAHDFDDFEVSRRHSLPLIQVIDLNGKMTPAAGKYHGMDRYKARAAIIDELQKLGMLVKIENYKLSLGTCYRCGTATEPMVSTQWFVKTEPLAEKAIEAVKQHKTRIIPQQWEKVYFEWMENIKDWCISRQIWWGHRIPAWYCEECNGITVSTDQPDKCSKCGSTKIHQDEDVLDTWFSSALWPFSTLGWPDKTPELAYYYPTSVLITAFDILFFWVARMMMMGLKFMGDVPFRDVYIHALVRDEFGKKMSKTKGNVIDPLVVIDKYGTDAFRFTLASMAAQGRDIKLSEQRIAGYRNFINKLWNSTRFVTMKLGDKGTMLKPEQNNDIPINAWINKKLRDAVILVKNAIDGYRFNDAAIAIYQFVWHEYCDWYIEMVKISDDNYSEKKAVENMLFVHDVMIRLMHPFIPFVTEEIYHVLKDITGSTGRDTSVMEATYPSEEALLDIDDTSKKYVSEVDAIIDVITKIRTIRAECNVPLSAMVDLSFSGTDEKVSLINKYSNYITRMVRGKVINTEETGVNVKGSAVEHIDGLNIYVHLAGVIEPSLEIQRLEKEMGKLQIELEKYKYKLSNEDFLKKAPEDVIEETKNINEQLKARYEQLIASLNRIKTLLK
ncbi:MAG: valine--tRNA ligase [bacterium]